MRKTILFLLVMSAIVLQAQQPTREELANEIDKYVAATNDAADTFLNRRLPADARIKAISPYTILFDEKQIEAFKNVAIDPEESPEVRAAALRRLTAQVNADERLDGLVIATLGNPRAPKVLRAAALETEQSLSFTKMSIPDVYQKMLDDPDLDYRVFAYTRLVAHGDARAQQRLIEGLENPSAAPMPAQTAIGILSMAPKAEYYPTLYKLLSNKKDEATRLEAARNLGAYSEARQALVAISQDASENVELREAALGSLYAGDRANIVQYVTPILSTDAPPRLQSLGIQMTADVRQAMPYRFKAKKADAYDQLVAKFARESSDPAVRGTAQKYIDSVRPKY